MLFKNVFQTASSQYHHPIRISLAVSRHKGSQRQRTLFQQFSFRRARGTIHFTPSLHLCLSTKYLRKVDKYLHNPYIRTLFISHLYFSPFILFVMFYSLFLKISSGFGIKNVTNKSFCHSNHILSENVRS